MAKYKITKMNTGFGDYVYTVNWMDGKKVRPSTPIRYYKTLAGAKRRVLQLKRFKL